MVSEQSPIWWWPMYKPEQDPIGYFNLELGLRFGVGGLDLRLGLDNIN